MLLAGMIRSQQERLDAIAGMKAQIDSELALLEAEAKEDIAPDPWSGRWPPWDTGKDNASN